MLRVVVAALLVALASGRASAQVAAASSPAPSPPPSPAQLQYAHERKSPALALTLEALCPLAGAGTFYTGTEGDKAGFLAGLSLVAAGAAVGSVFWLLHLDRQHASGGERAVLDFEQGTAISVLVGAGLVYMLARASGLSLASESTEAFNRDLEHRLSLP